MREAQEPATPAAMREAQKTGLPAGLKMNLPC